MYTIGAYYLQYCGSYAPHRRRWTPDARRWTLDAGPSTPYYKLTGELKMLGYNPLPFPIFSATTWLMPIWQARLGRLQYQQ